MTSGSEHPVPRPAARHTPDPERVEPPRVSQRVPHERHPYPCQRAYGALRRRILETLAQPRRNPIVSGLQHTASAGFLILDLILRWLMDLCDAVSGNRGYFAVGSVLAAYLAAFGLIDAKSTQEETRASIERGLFTTLVSSNNAASFVAAMHDFGPTQTMPATQHPSLLNFWQWGRTHQPNRVPMWRWAEYRLGECEGTRDCSLMDDVRLDLFEVDLRGAKLSDVDLTGADLGGADLTDANLRNADLTDAKLRGAILSNTDVGGAFLDHTDLTGAILSNTDLSDAFFVTQTQLNSACGDADTKPPAGLTIKLCPAGK